MDLVLEDEAQIPCLQVPVRLRLFQRGCQRKTVPDDRFHGTRQAVDRHKRPADSQRQGIVTVTPRYQREQSQELDVQVQRLFEEWCGIPMSQLFRESEAGVKANGKSVTDSLARQRLTRFRKKNSHLTATAETKPMPTGTQIDPD